MRKVSFSLPSAHFKHIRKAWRVEILSICRRHLTVKDQKHFEIREKNLATSVRMSETLGQLTQLRRVLSQLWDKWPKCVSDTSVSEKNDRNL